MKKTEIDGTEWTRQKRDINLISVSYGKSDLISRASIFAQKGLITRGTLPGASSFLPYGCDVLCGRGAVFPCRALSTVNPLGS